MPKAGFLSLAEELQLYILRFLPYRDILRCTSVCKALRQMYISYSELQYIVELGGQQLLPIPDTDPNNHTSISQRLQLLRDRAHAWFKLDVHHCATISIPEQFLHAKSSGWVANGHLCLWDGHQDSATVFQILPKASQQQTVRRDPSTRRLHLDPHAQSCDVFIDPAQNLIAIAYTITDGHLESGYETFCIDLEALDGGGIHPQATGQTLFLSQLPGYENSSIETDLHHFKLKGSGRHIAFWRSVEIDGIHNLSVLQIWDWQHSTTSGSVLIHDLHNYYESADFCFIGNDRLLIFGDNLKLYSIEDMSQAPQFLACFLMPVSMTSIGFTECILPMDDIAYSTQMQARQTMWTSDPKNRLLMLLVITFRSTLVFIISTRMFFNPDFSEGMQNKIPWKDWGPLNSRAFRPHRQCRVGISGNRVLLASPADVHATEYNLQVMDFSPLAVERREGFGRVVKESSMTKITDPESEEEVTLTTNLPYVEVVLDRTFDYPAIQRIWIDEDRIYLCHTHGSQLEVIEVTPRAAEAANPTTSSA
ncbi:hypothetical protein EDB19DRAFT_574829 [Suillus lakei]|nr:hypothetical protein EDB19DRAFT_574829 [Suillus lakei]